MTWQLLVRLQRYRDRRRCHRQFPRALVMVSGGLRAGLNLQQAIALVAAQGPRPLADAFARAEAVVSVGVPLETAVATLAERVGGEDAAAFSFAVGVLFETGGNLIATCDRLVTTTQERERVRGRIRVLTAQGTASGVIIAVMPLLVCGAMSVLMPHLVQPLFTTNVGRLFLIVGLMLQAIGLWWMRQIVRVKV